MPVFVTLCLSVLGFACLCYAVPVFVTLCLSVLAVPVIVTLCLSLLRCACLCYALVPVRVGLACLCCAVPNRVSCDGPSVCLGCLETEY